MAVPTATRKGAHQHDDHHASPEHHQDSPAPAAPMGLLTVGAADHPAEAAADAAATRALSSLDRIRRAPAVAAGCGHEGHDQGHVHRELDTSNGVEVGHAGGALEADTDARIQSLRGRGRPLPAPLRREMETAFDTPLERVRVHTGTEAADLNSRMSARAFTVGQDIFFGGDQLTSGADRDRHTVAHEIAHTLQGPDSVHRELVSTVRRDGKGGTGGTATKPKPKPKAPAPRYVMDALDRIDSNDPLQDDTYYGWVDFYNNEGLLPTEDDTGAISYTEWDVNPAPANGKGRDAKRIVTGDDGSAYVTYDHYKSFTKLR